MAIAFVNNADNTSQGTNSFNFNAGTCDFLFVVSQGTTAPTGFTYNGVAMTQIGTNQVHSAYGRTINIWGLIAPTQNSSVSLAQSGGANVDIGVVSMLGVHQTTPYTGFAKADVLVDTTPSLSVTTTTDNANVVGCFFGNWSSVGADTTVVRQVTETAFQMIRSTNVVTPAGSFTLNANSADGAESVIIATGINPAAGGGGGTVLPRKALLGVGQ